MTKASDKELGVLHQRLAKAMLSALDSADYADQADALLDKYREELPEDVSDFLEKCSMIKVDASLYSSITKFLKDNDITCAIEDDETTTELQKKLNNKRRISELSVVENE